MTEPKLTPLEDELLVELFQAQQRFEDGRVTEGTIRSQALYRMATRRGETLPAPVAGKTRATSSFSGVFTRTLNRLVSKKLVRKRKVHNFKGHHNQWGYANHQRKDRDLFLTELGRKMAQDRVTSAKAVDGPDNKPPSEPSVPRAFQFSYVSKPPTPKTVRMVTDRWSYQFGPVKVTYLLMKERPTSRKQKLSAIGPAGT